MSTPCSSSRAARNSLATRFMPSCNDVTRRLVTSLHDGMNLVAKEFLAARDDEQGVLILSRFTGAARELNDALIVNPYDTEQMAEAIRLALELPAEERKARMQRMRRVVQEHNVYRWAGNLIAELSNVRVSPENIETMTGLKGFS